MFAFRGNLVPDANLFLTSMFLVVYNLNSRDRTVARQLNFNHRIVKVQTQNKSAVKWVVLATCVFLLWYGIFLRCSLFSLTGHKCGNDSYYKITLEVINSVINRIVSAFFKRDIKQECGRLLFKRRRYFTAEQFRRKKNISWCIPKTFLDPEDFRFRIYSWHINSYLYCCSVKKLPMKQR